MLRKAAHRKCEKNRLPHRGELVSPLLGWVVRAVLVGHAPNLSLWDCDNRLLTQERLGVSCSPSLAGYHWSQLRNKTLCPISMEDVGFHFMGFKTYKRDCGKWYNIDMKLWTQPWSQIQLISNSFPCSSTAHCPLLLCLFEVRWYCRLELADHFMRGRQKESLTLVCPCQWPPCNHVLSLHPSRKQQACYLSSEAHSESPS